MNKSFLFLWMLLSASALSLSAAVADGFDNVDGYSLGDELSQHGQWMTQGSVHIDHNENATSTDLYARFSTSLPESSASISVDNNEDAVKFIDFYIRSTALPYGQGNIYQSVGSSLWFYIESETGYFYVMDEHEGETVAYPIGDGYPLDPNGLMEGWVRVTIREDYVSGKWDVYLDGKPVVSGLSLAEVVHSGPQMLTFFGNSLGDMYLNSFSYTDENPLFTDEDKDGLPDDWEALYGIDTGALGDAYADLDGDGLANLQEYQNGRIPTLLDFDSHGEINYYYVNNNAVGDDSYNGKSAIPGDIHGPKETITAAVAAASSGDVITVIEGTYPAASWSSGGKDLNIRTFGDVTFQ